MFTSEAAKHGTGDRGRGTGDGGRGNGGNFLKAGTLLKGVSKQLHIHPYYSVTFSRHEKSDFYISKAGKRPSKETQQYSDRNPSVPLVYRNNQ